MQPARQLHDKILWADALMNKADWLTGFAAAVGVIGIGFGLWWADAVAAPLIALDVVRDGYHHTGAAIRDLTGEMPRSVDDKEFEPLVGCLKQRADGIDWVRESRLRVREEGRYLVGTIFVLPSLDRVDPIRIREAERDLLSLHWRLHDLSVVPVPDFDGVRSGRTEPDENK